MNEAEPMNLRTERVTSDGVIPAAPASQLERERNEARAATEKMRRERDALKHWKESAMSVSPPLQDIGRELGLTLGQSIHDKILPAIIQMRRDMDNVTQTIALLIAGKKISEDDLKLAFDIIKSANRKSTSPHPTPEASTKH